MSSCGLRTPASGTRSAGGRCESCGASSNASDGDSVSDAPLIKNMNQLKPNTNMQDRQRITGYASVHVPTWSTLNSSVNEARDVEPPAMKALRSLSQPPSPNVGNQTLRRMSSALAATLGFLKPNTGSSKSSESSHKVGKRPEASQERSAHRHNLSNPSRGLSRRTTFKDTKSLLGMLGTPATIILRKAGNVYAPTPVSCSMNASLLNEYVHKPDPGAPASELLALYSTPAAVIDSPKTLKRVSPELVSSPSSMKTEASSNPDFSPRAARKRSLSMAHFKKRRRYSFPAEAALTFVDVHAAPGSFAVEPRSRRASLIPAECLRHISIIHFRSHNSFHKVI